MGTNYSEKEVEVGTRMLKLYASYCARFWAEKLTDTAAFWSCKDPNKSMAKMGTEFIEKNVPYVAITTQQIFKFIKLYEKLSTSEIALISKNDNDLAVVLGYSDSTITPGFTSGVKDKGDPEFFLMKVMKEAGISGVFLNMKENHIAIKSGKLYLEHRNEKQELLST